MHNPRPHNIAKKIATIALEIVLVVVIIGLILATWLPAMIGANPDGQPTAPVNHRR